MKRVGVETNIIISSPLGGSLTFVLEKRGEEKIRIMPEVYEIIESAGGWKIIN